MTTYIKEFCYYNIEDVETISIIYRDSDTMFPEYTKLVRYGYEDGRFFIEASEEEPYLPPECCEHYKVYLSEVTTEYENMFILTFKHTANRVAFRNLAKDLLNITEESDNKLEEAILALYKIIVNVYSIISSVGNL